MARWRVTMEMRGELPNVRRAIRPLVGALAETARGEWIRQARQNLRTSMRAYVNSISTVEQRGSVATIRLRGDTADGKFANAIEEGKQAFDMKPGFLRSRKAKRGRGGPYMHIPLGQKVPGGGDRGPNVMPWSIYKLAKAMPVNRPLTLPNRLSGYGLRTKLSPNASKWGPYTWKTSPYAGIIKSPIGSPRGPMQYKTFRTVSRRSDPNSWIHPGFRARNLMERAQANFERMMPAVVDRVLDGLI